MTAFSKSLYNSKFRSVINNTLLTRSEIIICVTGSDPITKKKFKNYYVKDKRSTSC